MYSAGRKGFGTLTRPDFNVPERESVRRRAAQFGDLGDSGYRNSGEQGQTSQHLRSLQRRRAQRNRTSPCFHHVASPSAFDSLANPGYTYMFVRSYGDSLSI